MHIFNSAILLCHCACMIAFYFKLKSSYYFVNRVEEMQAEDQSSSWHKGKLRFCKEVGWESRLQTFWLQSLSLHSQGPASGSLPQGSVSQPLAPPLSSWPCPQTQAPPPRRVLFYHSRPRPADSGPAPSPHCSSLASPLRPRPGRPPYWSFCPSR